jgi:ADP-ribose pyrophosphatase YjhB (NUDIX family)
MWHVPGGGVKRRESLDHALRRELREEAGVIVTGPLRLLGSYSSLVEGKSDHISVFIVNEWDRTAVDDAEIAAAGFFFPSELPPGASGGTRRRLEDWQRGEVTDFGW